MLISVHFLLRFLFCIAKRFLMWWFLPDSFLQFLRNAFFTVIFQRFANKVLRLLRLKGMTTVTVSSEEAVTLLNEPNKNIFNKKDDLPTENFPKVVFVLGGPGCGKGTQCAKIVDKFGFTHLSAGDLLRAEINSGSENGTMIQNMVKEGKIVPAEVTVKLLQAAMRESGNDKFLIDGFPRDEENRAAFESVTGIIPEFILFFDCPEEEMEKRILSRNQGRVDDNSETIKKRFKVFVESSLPVINYYESLGRVRKIDAAKSMDEVFQSIQPLFLPSPKMVELEGDPRMAEVEAVDEARVATVRQ